MLAAGGAAAAKPDHAGNGKGKSRPPAVAGNGPVGYGAGGCPPGLQKNELCMPPGRYKKLFEIGERVPKGYDGLRSYGPLHLRSAVSVSGGSHHNGRPPDPPLAALVV